MKNKIITLEDVSENCQSSADDDGGATYLSDTFISGLYTPYSTLSGISKITGISFNNKRKAKENRKFHQTRYNLRSGSRMGDSLYF